MERYGVYDLADESGRVVLLQYPGLEASQLVVVAPLVPAGSIPEIPILTPAVNFEDTDMLVLITRLAAIPLSSLGKVQGTLASYDYEFQRAHQRLFFGN